LKKQIIEIFTAERLATLLVTIVGAVVGAYAAKGMSPVQWAGAVIAVLSAIAVAVIVHRWPAKSRASAR
jgi:preprotein translocase subunit SecF